MSNRIKLTAGQRNWAKRHGLDPSLMDAVVNNGNGGTGGTVDEIDRISLPKNDTELATFLGTPSDDRTKVVSGGPATMTRFISRYSREQQADGTDLNRLVQEEAQRTFHAMLRDMEESGGPTGVKRLNLDPQTRPANMLTSHRQAAAYNSKAAGAGLDKEFSSATEYFGSIWHLNNNADTAAKISRLRNAYSSVTPSDGGFLVPEALRSQLLMLALENSVVRPRATVVPMETARVQFPMVDTTTNQGSLFGGMIAYWGEESAALTESQAKFARATLDAKKLTGFAVVPNELLSDSMISFAALLETLWPQALAFFEDVAFLTGTGVGEPLGLLGANNPAGIAVSAEVGQATATIVLENIVNQYSRMLPSSLNSAVWLASPETLPQLFTMALNVGTGGAPVMLSNVAGAAPVTIFSRPLIITEKASRLGTRADLAFVDLRYYLIGDRQQMSASSSTDYRFGNDQTAFRIIQRVDGRPWLQNAITPANGGSTLSPFVEIATR